MLDEVHLLANGSLSDDVVTRLEDLETQFGQHGGDKVWISVGKQRHGGHQFTTVKVNNLLQKTQKSVLDFRTYEALTTQISVLLHVYISIIIKAA